MRFRILRVVECALRCIRLLTTQAPSLGHSKPKSFGYAICIARDNPTGHIF